MYYIHYLPVSADLVSDLNYKEMKTISVPKLCINIMSIGVILKF